MRSAAPATEVGEDGEKGGEPSAGAPGRRASISGIGPWIVVGAAIAFGLVEVRAETTIVAYLNDSSVHEEMARFAAHQFANGHLPLDSWFPFLSLGSAEFLHYQSLGPMIVGLLGVVFGTDRVFAWSLYLLVACWPISVYWMARLFGLSRWTAAIAALCSPFVTSAIGVGYEQGSYLWTGFGVWTQLWAMWSLPLAWGFSWIAVSKGRHYGPAVLFVSLTAAFHFLTGYLAFLPLVLWPFLAWRDLGRRILRAAVIGAGSALAASWVLVPLLRYGPWAARNEFLQHGPDADSYGARRVLSWLVEGHLFDDGRWPVLTALVLVGLLACAIRFRVDERARAIVGVFLLSLALFFGRPTFGPLMALLPGSRDLFLRRFIMGVQLAGLLLSAIGAVTLYRIGASLARRLRSPLASAPARSLRPVVVAAVAVLLLSPAWSQIASHDAADAREIAAQASDSRSDAANLAPLIARIEASGAGRTYAGMPTNWGSTFLVGEVPVFKYLSSQNVDEVGYTLRTEALMTGPEAYFDENNPNDYSIFGVRYLLLPAGRTPPVAASLLARRGPYALWEIPGNGDVQVVDTAGSIVADRTDVGSRSSDFVRTTQVGSLVYPTVAFAGRPPAPPTLLRDERRAASPGSVLAEHADLEEGTVEVAITARRTAVVLLKASFDPQWTAEVDGVPAPTEMVAPAMVGVRVSPGTHTVSFRYRPFALYPLLFALSALTVAGFFVVPVLWRRRRSKRSESEASTAL